MQVQIDKTCVLEWKPERGHSCMSMPLRSFIGSWQTCWEAFEDGRD
jgi:hypothetical protein